MRNIFEDEPFRSEDVSPEPQPPAPQPSEPTQPAPQVQLTNEQIAALLQQFLASQQPKVEDVPTETTPVKLEGLPTGVNPGTRILFQSSDYERKDSPQEETPVKDLPPIEPPMRPMASQTQALGNFAVDELEPDIEELPLPSASTAPIRTTGFETVALPDSEMIVEELSMEGDPVQTQPVFEPVAAQPQKKKRNVKKIIRRTVLTISVIAILVSAAVLVKEFFLHKENETFENEVTNLIVERETTVDSIGNVIQLTDEQMWEHLKAEYPNVVFPMNMQFKYARYYVINQDFVGYIEADGIGLSLPVVQTRNDSDYLQKSFYGKLTKYGSPFVSSQNNIAALDMNTVIYGHHMNDRSIFGALDSYKTLKGYKEAPVISFDTLYADYDWKVIAAFITNSYPEDDNGYVFNYYFPNLTTNEKKAAYFNELAQRSIYDTGVDVRPDDKILTLSTCSHEFENARLVVVARMVRPDESPEVDTSRAVVNSNPRYPQAYYTKKNLSNPYVNGSRWLIG